LPVVLLEDLGALIGLVLALAGVTLTAITGEADGTVSAPSRSGCCSCIIAVVLAVEMKTSSSVRRRATSTRWTFVARSRRATRARLIHMARCHLGPDEMLVAAKVELEPDLAAGAWPRQSTRSRRASAPPCRSPG